MIASPLHVILRQVKDVHFRVPLVIIVCGGTDHHSRSSSWREPVVHPHSVHRQAATTSMLACYLAIATSWHMIDTNVDMITTKWHPIAHKGGNGMLMPIHWKFVENLQFGVDVLQLCCNWTSGNNLYVFANVRHPIATKSTWLQHRQLQHNW